MMDLIDRAVAIEEVDDTVTSVSVCATVEQARGATWAKKRIRERLEKMPTIEAVPLDKLCEWLETNCILSCVECEHLFGGQWCKQHPELPYRCHRKEHWKNVLTKWMEGLYAEVH